MKKRLRKIRVPLGIGLGLILVVVFYFAQSILLSGTFLPGVYIADTLVAGKTEEQVTPLLENKFQTFYRTPVKFYKDGFEYQTTLEKIAKPLNLDEDISAIWAKERQRPLKDKIASLVISKTVPYYPELCYDEEILQELVEEWNEELKVGAKNATLEINREKGLVIVPEQPGLQVDFEKTFAGLPRQIDSNIHSCAIPIVLKEEQPKVLAKDLSNMGEISSYTTNFNTGEVNRSKNLHLAASRVNGSMLAVGEEFQFNRTVGKRTVEEGFSDALIIVGGKFEPGLGGGVCQVSSTIYNACLLAGLEIVERYNHGLSVAYVPLGLDATVVYGVQDFRFRNNTSAPIYIRAVTNGNQLTVNFYGDLKDKKNVKLTHVVDRVIAFSEILEPRADLKPGERIVDVNGQSGYNVRAFQSFYDEAGQLISTKQLSSDYYRPLNRVVLVGPDVSPVEDISNETPNSNGDTSLDENTTAETNQVRPPATEGQLIVPEKEPAAGEKTDADEPQQEKSAPEVRRPTPQPDKTGSENGSSTNPAGQDEIKV